METIKSCIKPVVFLIEFKSYYVVWKQDIASIDRVVPIMFKSYYVVWKLNILRQRVKEFFKFKSYYVVWKLL